MSHKSFKEWILALEATMMSTQEAMKILGLTKLPNEQELRSAYRQAAKSSHPDVGGNFNDFIRIESAYRALLASLKQDDGSEENDRALEEFSQEIKSRYRGNIQMDRFDLGTEPNYEDHGKVTYQFTMTFPGSGFADSKTIEHAIYEAIMPMMKRTKLKIAGIENERDFCRVSFQARSDGQSEVRYAPPGLFPLVDVDKYLRSPNRLWNNLQNLYQMIEKNLPKQGFFGQMYRKFRGNV